ncbi:MAG TPA: DUF362 domain-containing protein [Anaerolineae bacterium]|nr:DUF362 domain-containing protein [Anaerolineae bacterium]
MFSRRDFLKTSTIVPFVCGPFFSGTVFAEKSADIGVAQGTDIESIVRAAVASVGGIGAYVKKGDRVIIKPNLSFASPPERGATTNPEVLNAVMKLCIDAGAQQVIVVDHPLQQASIIGTKSAVAQVVKNTQHAVLILATTENLYEETPIPQGKTMKSTQTVKILKEADVLINLPVAKNHSATFVSLGIKGNLGLVYDRTAFHNSSNFLQSLADLATIIKADLTIVDAVRALTTRGPQGPGTVVKLDTIVAGVDPVAVDAYATELTPWNNRAAKGSNIQYLKYAAEMGLGEIDPSKLTVVKNIL